MSYHTVEEQEERMIQAPVGGLFEIEKITPNRNGESLTILASLIISGLTMTLEDGDFARTVKFPDRKTRMTLSITENLYSKNTEKLQPGSKVELFYLRNSITRVSFKRN